ncbi:dephospho-CoA kinase [Ramlibacter rhizophilus]|uniref:Dephospho-CoA kinase n=1 Tax=Ramlibacter rhizophilus TaxID=1781167 RepID=A0A4Z0BQJ9_9BURK|nr:dephospho-CoA kinase [Ramlibacter rhizophilus]TFZ01567.1 dephospho-CoA kinase [Ramlibacter rhizophilus]
MLRIGLTGGIGSGKSTVLAMLVERGAAAIDADAHSRRVTAPGGAAIEPIRQAFGDAFIAPDGGLDRARMREHAYTHRDARARLEAIIHPLVGQGIQRDVDEARSEGRRCLVFDIPLLVESGRWRREVDRVLVVDCGAHTQVERVKARSGLSEAQVEAIIAAQAPRALRLAAADLVIFNDGIDLAQLRTLVDEAAKSFGL